MEPDREHFYLESTVRGHHVYKSIWTPFIGQVLQTSTEENGHDRFAIAVKKDDIAVGHVPREHSKVEWYFLRHGGEISCEITGRRKRSSVAGKGLESAMYLHLSWKSKDDQTVGEDLNSATQVASVKN